MKNLLATAVCLLCLSFMLSCSDDDEQQVGEIEIEFDNVVGTEDLELNTDDEPYTNSAGESYKVTTLRYYISNISLKRSDGTMFYDVVTADGSTGYYLVDESDHDSQHISLENVPAGDYNEITFTIGVDFDQLSGSPEGPLDSHEGMFWDSDKGYIFVMVEGQSIASVDADKDIAYHVGGYKSSPSDPDLVNNIQTKAISFGSMPAMIRNDRTPEVHMIVDVNKFFESPNEIRFSETPVQYSQTGNSRLADNYANTFIVDHVHN